MLGFGKKDQPEEVKPEAAKPEDKPQPATAEEIAGEILAKDTPERKPGECPHTPQHTNPAGCHEKAWGMPEDQVRQFFGLVYLGLERMSERQRTMFRRSIKAASRDLNALWPKGKPISKIREEAERAAAEDAAKTKIIIPQGVNADALKQQK